MPSVIRISMRVKSTKVLEAYARLYAVPEMRRRVAAAAGSAVSRSRQNILNKLRSTPPRRTNYSPDEWTSDAQRLMYFATGGFGKGIPTERSGEIVDAWNIETLPEQGEITRLRLINRHPDAAYVIGRPIEASPPYQQGFHKTTGWYTISELIPELRQDIDNEVAKSITAAEDRAREQGIPTE